MKEFGEEIWGADAIFTSLTRFLKPTDNYEVDARYNLDLAAPGAMFEPSRDPERWDAAIVQRFRVRVGAGK